MGNNGLVRLALTSRGEFWLCGRGHEHHSRTRAEACARPTRVELWTRPLAERPSALLEDGLRAPALVPATPAPLAGPEVMVIDRWQNGRFRSVKVARLASGCFAEVRS